MKNYKNRNIKITILLMILIIIVFSLLINIQILAQYKRGSPAPNFTLEAVDGKFYQLSEFNNIQGQLFLCFVKVGDSSSVNKLRDLITFLENYKPRENYQVITVIENGQDNKKAKEQFLSIQKNTKIPIIILMDDKNKVINNYQIKRFPTFLLLRTDLYINRVYDRFTTREERSFYQYLSFILTSQQNPDNNSNECNNNGICPPPPGY